MIYNLLSLAFGSGFHKTTEKRMGTVWTGLQFRMRLRGDEPWMLRKLDHLDDSSVRGSSAKLHTVLKESGTVIVVYFITMTMALGNLLGSVHAICLGILFEDTWISTKS